MPTPTTPTAERHLKFVNPESSATLNADATDEITQEMFKVMASSYSLLFLIQGCHWNIMGPHFLDLHKLFGDFYQGLMKAIDQLAERLRALGVEVPYTPERFASASSVPIKSKLKGEHEILESSIQGYQELSKATHKAIKVCRKHEDFASAYLLTRQLTAQEDAAWQLISISSD